MQRAILADLEAQGGKATTAALMEGRNMTSFYRALDGLVERGLVTWVRGHGGGGVERSLGMVELVAAEQPQPVATQPHTANIEAIKTEFAAYMDNYRHDEEELAQAGGMSCGMDLEGHFVCEDCDSDFRFIPTLAKHCSACGGTRLRQIGNQEGYERRVRIDRESDVRRGIDPDDYSRYKKRSSRKYQPPHRMHNHPRCYRF
jgi:hypothetical protein